MNHIPSTRLKVPHGKWLMVNLMFFKHLQQHIIKSKATFPVTVVLALLIWTVGVQWPLDSDTHIASWWWEGIYCPVWTIELTNLICCGYTVFLLANLNEIYSLSGHRSTLHSSIFLLLWATSSLFNRTFEENLTPCFLLMEVSCLFRCHQESMPIGQTLTLFLLVSLNSLFCPVVLWYVPFFYIALFFFKGMTPRTFFAGVIGVVLPYWFLFVYFFCTDKISIFHNFWDSFPKLEYIDISKYPIRMWYILEYALLLLVSGCVYMELNRYQDKIRTRLFLHTFLWMSFYSLFLIAFQPESFQITIIPVLFGASLLGGHMFALSSTKFSNLSFIAAILSLLLIITHSVWKQ